MTIVMDAYRANDIRSLMTNGEIAWRKITLCMAAYLHRMPLRGEHAGWASASIFAGGSHASKHKNNQQRPHQSRYTHASPPPISLSGAIQDDVISVYSHCDTYFIADVAIPSFRQWQSREDTSFLFWQTDTHTHRIHHIIPVFIIIIIYHINKMTTIQIYASYNFVAGRYQKTNRQTCEHIYVYVYTAYITYHDVCYAYIGYRQRL